MLKGIRINHDPSQPKHVARLIAVREKTEFAHFWPKRNVQVQRVTDHEHRGQAENSEAVQVPCFLAQGGLPLVGEEEIRPSQAQPEKASRLQRQPGLRRLRIGQMNAKI